MPDPTTSQKNSRPDIIKVKASHGVKWLIDAFKLFTSQLKTWLVISAFLLILLLIPGLNQFVALLFPIPIAGLMIGCRQISTKSNLVFDHLFCALKTHTKPLLIICSLYALSSLVITLVTYLIMQMLGYDIASLQIEKLQQMQPDELLAWMLSPEGIEMMRTYTLTLLIYLALLLPVMMAYWFAPALVVLNNISPLNSLKLSYKACKINFVAFSVYGVVGFLYMILAFTLVSIISAIIPLLSIPLILLLFLSIFSISLASIYTSYSDIFLQKDLLMKNSNGSTSSMIA